MKKYNSMLKSARLKNSWTPEFVSKQVGVSKNTYSRWEAGLQNPNAASLTALCRVFQMSAEELGFMQSAIVPPQMPIHEHILHEETEKGSSSYTNILLEDNDLIPAEVLTYLTDGLAACWRLYMTGGQSELSQLVPQYLVRLMPLALSPGPDQKTAASLTSQAYQLLALLELQRCDFAAAQANATQAVVFSQLSTDWNVYIAAQLRMATIFSVRKRSGSALSAYNDALSRVAAGNNAISPVLHSWIFAGLAEIQAIMGRENEALQLLKLAFTVFPKTPETDSCFPYTLCDRSLLYLYEGLIFLHLGKPRFAWDAFAQVDELKPAPAERVRVEFLKHRTYTSLILGNMIQSCIYLEATVRAAQEIQSELAFSEVYTLYEHMLALWGQEARVRALAKLFQQ